MGGHDIMCFQMHHDEARGQTVVGNTGEHAESTAPVTRNRV